MRIRRSELVTPANDLYKIEKASNTNADEVIIDIEDAVAPNAKEDARETVIQAVRELDWDGKLLSVRINGFDTEFVSGDVQTIVGAVGDALDTVVLPMVSEGAEVVRLADLLADVELASDISEPVGIEVMIEQAAAIENIYDIAGASDRVESLIFGKSDYSATLVGMMASISPTDGVEAYPDALWQFVQMTMLHAASTYGLDAIDTIGTEYYTDLERFERGCENAKSVGFVGHWAIHPDQVDLANAVYTPDEATVDYAETVVAELEAAHEEGRGVSSIAGTLIDTAHSRNATSILERSRAIAEKDGL